MTMERRKVINRDNIVEDLNIEKIREKLLRACDGLEVNMVELESNIDSIYEENITTQKIQASLINTAVAMTTFEESDWSYVAGRLLMMEAEREVYHSRGFSYGDFSQTIKKMVELGLYDERLLSYTEEELNQIAQLINIKRDMVYDYAGANMLVNRYLIKHEGKTFELPQEIFLTISMMLALNEKVGETRVEIVKEFYNALSFRKLSLATPILANLRIPNGNLSSCFITAIDDNIESIFYNIDSIAKISKNGGGVGVNVSRIRAKGSMVNGYYNASGGVVPWIRIINDTAVAVNQQGRRAGAVTVALDTWHLDIETFLELQTENGDQRGKAYDIYPQVVCSNLFMKRVKNNESWTLLDPYEIRKVYGIELCELYGYEFENLYEKIENDSNIIGGEVSPGDQREFGYAQVKTIDCELTRGLSDGQPNTLDVWMSHGDKVSKLPEGFCIIGDTPSCPVAMIEHAEKQFYGIQFHPEVTHTKQGRALLNRFVLDICGAQPGWTMPNYIDEAVAKIREQVGSDEVILGLSGGVDSSVAAALIHRAIGNQLTCVFVDHGLLRLNEGRMVMDMFARNLGVNVVHVDATGQFMDKLAGVSDPEQKRKIIGREFIEVFDAEEKKLTNAKWLAQGTIYPDVRDF